LCELLKSVGQNKQGCAPFLRGLDRLLLLVLLQRWRRGWLKYLLEADDVGPAEEVAVGARENLEKGV
jgi:hypothetical protein